LRPSLRRCVCACVRACVCVCCLCVCAAWKNVDEHWIRAWMRGGLLFVGHGCVLEAGEVRTRRRGGGRLWHGRCAALLGALACITLPPCAPPLPGSPNVPTRPCTPTPPSSYRQTSSTSSCLPSSQPSRPLR